MFRRHFQDCSRSTPRVWRPCIQESSTSTMASISKIPEVHSPSHLPFIPISSPILLFVWHFRCLVIRTQDNVWNLYLFLCESLFFQCKIKGTFVIMENYKSLFAKVFNIGSKFNFVKGFLSNILAIIALAALLQISPKIVEICYQKVHFLY